RRPARPGAEAAREADHRALRASRLQADAAGLFRPRQPRQLRQAHPAPAGRGTVLARPVREDRNHAHLLTPDTKRPWTPGDPRPSGVTGAPQPGHAVKATQALP